MSLSSEADREDAPLMDSLSGEQAPAKLGRPVKAAMVAFAVLVGGAAVALVAAQRLTMQGSPLPTGAAPRELQAMYCNPQVQPVQPVSQAFPMTGDWAYFCRGQGSTPVPPPPSETDKFPGQQNWCWNWMKHKGCKDVVATKNWRDAQDIAAAAQLAPYAAYVPMEPVQNPALCSDYNLGATVYAQPQEAQMAQAWFQANVALYVVALPAEAERKAFMQTRLQQLGIQFSFLDGVDLRVPGSYAAAKTRGVIPMDFNFQAADANGGGVAGMVGCAAAHLGAMLTIVTSQQPQPLAVVLEDDVTLEDDFVIKLYHLLTQEAPCDWEVISLKSACPYGACVTQHLTRVMPDVNEPEARCRHGVNYGFYGMLYKKETLNDVRAKLSQRVWDPNVPHCLDVDVALASISDQLGYYAVPYWQAPGFLQMGGHGSTRTDNNNAPVDTTEPR